MPVKRINPFVPLRLRFLTDEKINKSFFEIMNVFRNQIITDHEDFAVELPGPDIVRNIMCG